MTLTDEERRLLAKMMAQGLGLDAIFLAGKRAMQEEAARICDAMHEREDDNCAEAAYAIRAIGKTKPSEVCPHCGRGGPEVKEEDV